MALKIARSWTLPWASQTLWPLLVKYSRSSRFRFVDTHCIADPTGDDDFEVFKKHIDGVDFRTVSWPTASVIFLKGTSLGGKNGIREVGVDHSQSFSLRES